jgi:hypothetical protein
MTTVLNGLWTWLWPRRGWAKVDPAKVAADLRDLGIEGVIPHSAFSAAGWLYDKSAPSKPIDRIKPFLAEGVKVAVGIGRSDGLDDKPKEECAQAIQRALDLPYQLPAMLDWEGKYDLADGKPKAAWIAAEVLRTHGNAPGRIVDCPWWAPLYRMKDGKKGYTHPSAPYAEFGRLVTADRYVQSYGSRDGESLEMVTWSRDPSQYPAIAKTAGVPAWVIRPATTTYNRSWQDVARTVLAEPHQILWSYEEMTADCRKGLKVAKAARAAALSLEAFAASRGVAVDQLPAALSL